MTKMEKIIKRATEALDAVDGKQIADFVWENCRGIVIINVTDIGFVFSGAVGDGVVLKHNEDGTWGAPSCVKFSGAGAGAIFGKAKKQIFVFPMTDYFVEMLTGKTTNQFGVQCGAAAGPVGYEGQAGVEAGTKGANVSFTYVYENGAFLSIGINDYFIDAEKNENTHFYGKDADPTDIVMKPGTVEIPKGKGVEELHSKLAGKGH